MPEKVFTFGEVVADVSNTVLERGTDYIDAKALRSTACSYALDGRNTPGCRCVVGEFWHLNGVPEETLQDLDNIGTVESVRSEGRLPVLTTRKAYEFLRVAQREQDKASTYGVMLARALAETAAMDSDDVDPYQDQVLPEED